MPKIESLFARRFLKARKGNKLLSFLAITSIIGVMLGVTALIIVVSVMDGFTVNLKERFLGSNPHITIMNMRGNTIDDYDWRIVREIALKEDGVISASPVIFGQGMITSGNSVTGIMVRGLDVKSEVTNGVLDKTMVRGSLSELNASGDLPGILLGKELMFTTGSVVGREITLISPTVSRGAFGIVPKMRKFRVMGYFDTGFYEYNKNMAYIEIAEAQEFYNIGDSITAITVMTENADKSTDIAAKLQGKISNVSEDYIVRDWLSMNVALFSALKLERYAMFIVLMFIIVVASFNIISMISTTVEDKKKEISIIRAMGGSKQLIKSIFRRQGMIIGAIGTALGNILALIIGFILKNFKVIDIPQEIYHSETIPILLSSSTFIIVTICALVIVYIASIIPALGAAKRNPIEVIKND